MYKILLVCSVILAQVSLGDFNARIQHRRPRFQNTQIRPRVNLPRKKEEPQRRTFITALLAAEVHFLEGLLADQQASSSQQSTRQKARPRPQKQTKPSGPYQASSKPPKFVSKLDPFYMIAAPDLTKESPKTAEYEAPSEDTSTTTSKYGELEHYNLKGYLPPPPPPADSSYKAPAPVEYNQPPPPPPSTTAAPLVTKSYSTPAYEAPAPAPAYQPAAPSYEEPAPAPAYQPAAPSYEAPAPAPAAPSYEAPVPAPAYQPAAPSYEAPAPAPSYQPAAPAPVQNSEPSYSSPEPEYKLVIVPQPAYAAPAASYPAPAVNQHPHTFFHESQAQKVHDGGEWPTVYYNTFEGTKKTLIL